MLRATSSMAAVLRPHLPFHATSPRCAHRAFLQGLHAAAARGMGDGLPAYKLPQQPEFLFSEEAAVHRRSWSENLTFYTGSGYLSGTVAHTPAPIAHACGAFQPAWQPLSRSPASQQRTPARVLPPVSGGVMWLPKGTAHVLQAHSWAVARAPWMLFERSQPRQPSTPRGSKSTDCSTCQVRWRDCPFRFADALHLQSLAVGPYRPSSAL